MIQWCWWHNVIIFATKNVTKMESFPDKIKVWIKFAFLAASSNFPPLTFDIWDRIEFNSSIVAPWRVKYFINSIFSFGEIPSIGSDKQALPPPKTFFVQSCKSSSKSKAVRNKSYLSSRREDHLWNRDFGRFLESSKRQQPIGHLVNYFSRLQ